MLTAASGLISTIAREVDDKTSARKRGRTVKARQAINRATKYFKASAVFSGASGPRPMRPLMVPNARACMPAGWHLLHERFADKARTRGAHWTAVKRVAAVEHAEDLIEAFISNARDCVY